MNARNLLVLCGYGRAGKDSLAARYRADGWASVRISDPIKHVLTALNPVVGIGDAGEVRVSDLVSDYLSDAQWDAVKASPYEKEVIRLLQVLGAEASRDVLGESVWLDLAVRATLRHLDAGQRVVVTGIRYPNEADEFRRMGGLIVRVDRDGVGPRNGHHGEVALDQYRFDVRVRNRAGSTVEAFCEEAVAAIAGYAPVRPAVGPEARRAAIDRALAVETFASSLRTAP